nr:phospholipase-like protein [Tanacetum cinerariifolium]
GRSLCFVLEMRNNVTSPDTYSVQASSGGVTIWLSDDIERFISQLGQLKSMFPWSDDYTVSRNFWLRLVCLDPCRKGWLSEEVFIPINETDQHWCLAHLDILSRLVTFYDSGDTYDYEWRDWDLMKSISETQLKVLKKLSFIAKLRRQRMGVEFPCKNLFGDFLHVDNVADELGLHDNQLFEGLNLDGPIDVRGAKYVVLKKKKGRSMVKVTRKRKHQYYKKINRFRKVYGKRVSVEAGQGRLGGLVALNDHEVDDDPQLKSRV